MQTITHNMVYSMKPSEKCGDQWYKVAVLASTENYLCKDNELKGGWHPKYIYIF